MRWLLFISLLVLGAAACTPGSENSYGEKKALENRWALEGTFDKNTLEWMLTFQNKTESPMDLDFASGQEIEVTILKGEDVVYHYSDTKVFSQALKSISVGTGKTREWSERISPDVIKSGSYTVTFEILATSINGEKPTSPLKTSITIH